MNGKVIEEIEEKATVSCRYGPDANNEYIETKLTAMEYTLICEARNDFCKCDFENSGFRVISGDVDDFRKDEVVREIYTVKEVNLTLRDSVLFLTLGAVCTLIAVIAVLILLQCLRKRKDTMPEVQQDRNQIEM